MRIDMQTAVTAADDFSVVDRALRGERYRLGLHALWASSLSALLATGALAQSPQQLPGIVIQGATLDGSVSKSTGDAPRKASTGVSSSAQDGDAPPASGSTDEGVSGVAAYKIGSSVSVVTRADLERQQIRHAADALRSLPGVSVNRSGSFAGLTQVRLRGAEGNHTLVLIDGIEANATTDGEFDFSDLTTEDIERIEVIRGPQSGLYGSGAVGGVINVITRGGRGPLTISTRGEAGSFGTVDGSVRVSAGNDRAWGSLSLYKQRTDGFNIAPFGSEEDGAELSTFSFRGGVRIVPGLTLDLTMRQTTNRGDRDTQAPFPSTSGLQVDDPATFESKTRLGGVKLTWETLDGQLTHVWKATRNETDRSDTSVGFISDNFGERTNYGYAATYRFATPMALAARHSVTGLVEREQELFTPNSFSDAFAIPLDGVTRERNRLAFAGEYRGEFLDRLFVTGTVRRDDNDVFKDFTTWRSTAALSLPELAMRPHASVGTAVKFPTMFEQFGFIPSTFIPNPNLLPEESFGWDAGIEFTVVPSKVFVDITYFNSDLENKIRTVGFPSTPINLPGTSTREGVEVSGRYHVTRDLTLGASYTYLDARDPDGQEEIRRPPHSGRIDVTYAFANSRGLFNLSAAYNGDMKDTNFGPFPSQIVTLDNYWLVSAAASYKILPGVEMFGRVENVFDQAYQEVFGFETPGIAAYAGLRFTYEDPSTKDWSRSKE